MNLALALSELDSRSRVGLLDMDVFGPSIPRMMNLSGNPALNKSKYNRLVRATHAFYYENRILFMLLMHGGNHILDNS